MTCCFEPGQVLVLPSDGGVEALTGAFRQGDLVSPDVYYSVEDILRHYHLGQGTVPEGLAQMPKGFQSFPVLVRVPPGSEQSHAGRFRQLRGIRAALPNYYIRPSLASIRYNSAFVDDSISCLGLQAPSSSCGSGVTVAVLDTGVDSSVLNGPSSSIPQFDTDVPRDLGKGLTPYDNCGHGTVVASLIERGAPGVVLLPIKIMSQRGNLMGAIAGLYTAIAAKMPDLFNLSFSLTCEAGGCAICGYPFGDTQATFEQLKSLFAQVDDIYRYNGRPEPLLVAAAGNLSEGLPLAIPASLENVLAVGSCESGSRPQDISDYSRYGAVPANRFVRAPGGLDHPERCIAVTEPSGGSEPPMWGQERYYGTSFAAPLATAVAARYLCATRQSRCGMGASLRSRSTRSYLMDCIRDGADRSFPGYDQTLHGLGLVRYDLRVAIDNLNRDQ